MENISSQPSESNSYKKITIITVGSVIGATISFFFFLIIGAFSSDSGPNATSNFLVVLSYAIPIGTLICIVLSYVKKSIRIAHIGGYIAVLPVIAFIVFIFGYNLIT